VADPRRYVIRRAFVAPLGLALILMGALLGVSIAHGQPVAKLAFLVVFAIPMTIMFVASAFRRLIIDPAGVTSTSPFRTRRIEFARVTALETVRVRSRVFLTLEAGEDDFIIISNGYADFAGLVNTLIAAVPPTAVTEETRQLAANPPVRHADVGLVWFTLAALIYVLIAQFKG
jgi:hypothetical protein